METDQKTPNSVSLHQLPYSELKKLAKKHGIKGNLKAEKIISALVTMDSDDLESFSTPASKMINSSCKNKKEKFDQDMMTPLATPRRGTYSLGSPVSMKVDDIATTPAVYDKSVVDESNVPSKRESVKQLRSRKVSFVSPIKTPHTPKNINLRRRPKTPIASRSPLLENGLSPKTGLSVKNLDESVHNSPPFLVIPKVDGMNGSSTKRLSLKNLNKSAHKSPPFLVLPKVDKKLVKSLRFNDETPAKKTQVAKPKSSKVPEVKNNISSMKKNIATPKSSKVPEVKNDLSSIKKRIATPKSSNMLEVKKDMSSMKKRVATPNFKRIHEKAFEKMESIDDYQKRKIESAKKVKKNQVEFKSKVVKAKSKIPAFGGIPFIPSKKSQVSSLKNKNLKNTVPVEVKKKSKVEPENAPQKKSKFDLKASLSRKLGYKPYTGPLKPLTPSNALNTSSVTACLHKAKEPVIKVVKENRLQNRSALKGVRTNKRFELQMKNRLLQ